MALPLRSSSLVTALFALVLAGAGRAQTAPPAAPVPAANPVVDPVKAPAAPAAESNLAEPKHTRVMSNAVAASLADGMPKYNPPPKLPEPTPEEEAKDLRDTDKPRNRIIRLPKYTVTEPKPPVFTERNLHTKSERTDMALKKYYGLKIGNIAGMNNAQALLMYDEQERLDNMANLKDDARTADRSGDKAASDYISKETTRAYYRPSDFGWNSDVGPPSGK